MTNKLTTRDMLRFLEGPPGSASHGAALEALETLQMRFESEGCGPDRIAKLAQHRILASQTLFREEAGRQAWDLANRKVAEAVSRPAPLDFDLALELNGILTGHSPSVRDCPVYAGSFSFPVPDAIPAAREILETKILLCENAVIRAAWAYIWICNIHPFLNGNGRTARLFADAVLISQGMPPVCFPNLASSMVVLGYAGRDLSLDMAVARFLEGVKHSYRILLDTDAEG